MSGVKPGPSNMCELFLYDAMFDKLNPIDGKVTGTGKSFFEGRNIWRTCCVPKLFWMFKQQFVYKTCSVGILSLQFLWTMNNLLSYCGLVDAKIRASDKDLPVKVKKFL